MATVKVCPTLIQHRIRRDQANVTVSTESIPLLRDQQLNVPLRFHKIQQQPTRRHLRRVPGGKPGHARDGGAIWCAGRINRRGTPASFAYSFPIANQSHANDRWRHTRNALPGILKGPNEWMIDWSIERLASRLKGTAQRQPGFAAKTIQMS